MAELERRARPAVIPWRWRGRDVCSTLDAGRIRFVARDILEIIDAMIPEFETEPTHRGPLRDHATATTWSFDEIVSFLPYSDHPLATPLQGFLAGVVAEIEKQGPLAMEQAISPQLLVTRDEPTLL